MIDEALDDVAPARVTAGRDAESYLDEGNVYFNVGQWTLAIDRYTQALELDSGLTAGYYNRANARTRAGEYDAALGDYNRALEISHRTMRTRSTTAACSTSTGRTTRRRWTTSSARSRWIRGHNGDGESRVRASARRQPGGGAAKTSARPLSHDPRDAAARYGAARRPRCSATGTGRSPASGGRSRSTRQYAREAAADPKLVGLEGDDEFMRLLRDAGARQA